jgi:hypothetical protein
MMAITQIRNVDKKLWHKLKVEAMKQEKPLGRLVNEAIKEYLEKRDREKEQ